MKDTKKTRLFSLLLCCLMLVGVLPLGQVAYAEGDVSSELSPPAVATETSEVYDTGLEAGTDNKTFTVTGTSQADSTETVSKTINLSSTVTKDVPKTYTVTFDTNGHGSGPFTQQVEKGNTAQIPPKPTDEEWFFLGWYREKECINRFDFDTPITEDITLFAKWSKIVVTPIYYTVTFNANGHGNDPTAQNVKAGMTATKPADPTETGWTFGGWYTEAACTNAFDFNTPIRINTILYAKWTQSASPQTYTVTISSPIEHGSVSADKTSGLSAGDLVSLTVVPDAGYALEELIVKDEGTNLVPMETTTSFRMPVANVNVSATFKEITVPPVKYNIYINPMTNGSVTSDKAKAAEGEPVQLTITPDPGYELESLHVTYGMGAEVTLNADHSFTMPNADVVVNATFRKKTVVTHTSTFETTGHGTAPTTQTVESGKTPPTSPYETSPVSRPAPTPARSPVPTPVSTPAPQNISLIPKTGESGSGLMIGIAMSTLLAALLLVRRKVR